MSEPTIGQIMLFAGNYAPVGWMFCCGQLLPIEEYPVLYSIIGTTYGGNGQIDFALPDLRGTIPFGTGDGPDMLPVQLGESGSYFNPHFYVNSHGSQMRGTLGLNYCIAIEGIYPERS